MSTQSLPSMRGNFVLLRAGDLRLLLPQAQVGAARYREATAAADADQALALSSDMTLLPECPPGRFVMASLGADAGDDGIPWCWDDLQVLIDVELKPQPLPVTLVAPATPVDSFIEHGGELVYVCDAQRLQEFALSQGSGA